MANRLDTMAALVKKISEELGPEKSAMCARDCLYQYAEGGKALLDKTIEAWKRDLKDQKAGESRTDAERHQAWVPAIPL